MSEASVLFGRTRKLVGCLQQFFLASYLSIFLSSQQTKQCIVAFGHWDRFLQTFARVIYEGPVVNLPFRSLTIRKPFLNLEEGCLNRNQVVVGRLSVAKTKWLWSLLQRNYRPKTGQTRPLGDPWGNKRNVRFSTE